MGGPTVLKDTQPCPDAVTITDFTGKRNFYIQVTEKECYMVLLILKSFFVRPEVQHRLDKLVEDAKVRPDVDFDLQYRMLLTHVLNNEAYPIIYRRFQIPHDE